MVTTVALSPRQSSEIERLVAEGSFASTEQAVDYLLSEVLGDAPRYSPEELQTLQQGVDEAIRGEFVDQQEVHAFFQDWRRNG